MAIPGYLIVPNAYNLCKDHEGIFLKYEDVYKEDGTRKFTFFDKINLKSK
jgi:hypothetical protein